MARSLGKGPVVNWRSRSGMTLFVHDTVTEENAMKTFLARFGSAITSVLSGFDRLVLRGTLQSLMRTNGLQWFLQDGGVHPLQFKQYAQEITTRLRQASLREAEKAGRPVEYLEAASIDKEARARELLEQHPIQRGLICAFTVLEPCWTFEYHRSAQMKERSFRPRSGKCLHIYKYMLHPKFGFMNARIQTWFPFNVQVCLNGREWLARQLQARGSRFERFDNCFTWLEDPELAQRLMDGQLDTNWRRFLDPLAAQLNPLHSEIFKTSPMTYYWTGYQTEWATDLTFQDRDSLVQLYPRLVRHSLEHFKSPDIMRFLGRKPHGNFTGDVVTRYKDRSDGLRVKHSLRTNSVKMYNKAPNLLRVEATLNDPTDFKVYRPPHDDPEAPLKWQPLRKSVADLHRRAQVSQRANERYLDGLAVVDNPATCSEIFDAVSRRASLGGRPVRALRLGDAADLALLDAIRRGEFVISGFRNRDIRHQLHPGSDDGPDTERRRLSNRVSRLFRILRAHGIIQKVPKTHRYLITPRGRLLCTALAATRAASVQQLLAEDKPYPIPPSPSLQHLSSSPRSSSPTFVASCEDTRP